ncbi:MAG TPA: hypothetical protein PLG66_05995, partial [Calditrichia bacterium]|nr:hypothetical protein [Calditrichia bacterium]
MKNPVQLRRLVFSLGVLLSLSNLLFGQMPYQDRSLSPEKRAEDLIGRLTLAEKTTLLMSSSGAIARLGI